MLIPVMCATLFGVIVARAKIHDMLLEREHNLTERLAYLQRIFSVDKTCLHYHDCENQGPKNHAPGPKVDPDEIQRLHVTIYELQRKEQHQQWLREQNEANRQDRNAGGTSPAVPEVTSPAAPRKVEPDIEPKTAALKPDGKATKTSSSTPIPMGTHAPSLTSLPPAAKTENTSEAIAQGTTTRLSLPGKLSPLEPAQLKPRARTRKTADALEKGTTEKSKRFRKKAE